MKQWSEELVEHVAVEVDQRMQALYAERDVQTADVVRQVMDVLDEVHDDATFENVETETGLARRASEQEVLQGFARMVADLDRNEHGRHEGDVDASDPTGYSQGNPKFREGDIIGYSISGDQRPYVVPPRASRYDPAAWIAPRRTAKPS